jgi:hypothetical protein
MRAHFGQFNAVPVRRSLGLARLPLRRATPVLPRFSIARVGLVLLRRGADWEAIGEVIADLPRILSKLDLTTKQRE